MATTSVILVLCSPCSVCGHRVCDLRVAQQRRRCHVGFQHGCTEKGGIAIAFRILALRSSEGGAVWDFIAAAPSGAALRAHRGLPWDRARATNPSRSVVQDC
eukprot:NODE_6772_length_484_cov_262.839161.p2 GENE.NODE_6772_length_484_cov_262.839161~~NODE_6772_length_484_cov_262.839161.p2  ORF type:complete len:102 (+),score=5.35 NODE_6772_length_484_cov_262.839161:131-436(+)